MIVLPVIMLCLKQYNTNISPCDYVIILISVNQCVHAIMAFRWNCEVPYSKHKHSGYMSLCALWNELYCQVHLMGQVTLNLAYFLKLYAIDHGTGAVSTM